VGPRIGLDDAEKKNFAPTETLQSDFIGRPVRNQSHAILIKLYLQMFYLITNNNSGVIISQCVSVPT
jgi:hypothetical protein